MRRIFIVLCLLPLPAAADRFEAAAKLDAVKLYGSSALLTRSVSLTLPAGQHELLISNLPRGIDLGTQSVTPPEGVRVLTQTLAVERQPVTAELPRPEVEAAKADLKRREADLREAERAVQRLRLGAEAAGAEAQYLLNYGKDGSPRVTGPELLGALGGTVSANLLAARDAALTASFAAEDAERALEPLIKARDRAKQALDALGGEESKYSQTLTLGLDVAAAGEVTLKLTDFVPSAYWEPIYDLRLTRGETVQLQADRAVRIWQETDEDWENVELTLSTAQPTEQSSPSDISPQLRSIYDESLYSGGSGSSESARVAPAPVAEAPVILYDMPYVVDFSGANVTYLYPHRVDLRSSADRLRLELGPVTLAAEVMAAATPLYDETAYVLALARNTSPELLLPGTARLWFEGELVGETKLPLLAAGAETEIGFGAIHGLQVKRIMPERSQGRAGLIGRSYQQDENVRIELENLTGETWPLRLLDQVPYSEQETLSISYSADPKPTVTDREGQRGVLEWRFDLAPGEKRQVQLGWQLRWPSGYVLQ